MANSTAVITAGMPLAFHDCMILIYQFFLLHQNRLIRYMFYYYIQKTALKEHLKVAKLVIPKLVNT